jgi:hypothetical protein
MAPAEHAADGARPLNYWRLWLWNTALLTAAFLYFFTTQYGTREFLGIALAMAFLPLLATLLFVVGTGSAVLVAIKIKSEKRGWSRAKTLAWLVVPTLLLSLLISTFAYWETLPQKRLGYVCIGNAPAAGSEIQVTGYSHFFSGQWLAAFTVDAAGFQKFVTEAKLQSAPEVDFNPMLNRSLLKATKLVQGMAPSNNAVSYRRIFKAEGERERGGIYAVYDATTSRAMVYREYHD